MCLRTGLFLLFLLTIRGTEINRSTFGAGKAHCDWCGHACDSNCNCGICSGPSKCATEALCLGPCNAAGNAKWCGPTDPPTPPPTAPKPPPKATWSTSGGRLQKDGANVVLHGFGTTCTEYLLRGIGMKCFVSYDNDHPASLMQPNSAQLNPLISIVTQVSSAQGVVPAVRIPMTASSWLGIPTNASAANMKKYPELGQQYQKFVTLLAETYTENGIVVILDLHWSDDDTDNAPMAKKGAVDCVAFWDSVASAFAKNDFVFFELYNEPHVQDVNQWMNGDTDTAGMLEMFEAVRKHSSNPVIIAGAKQYAYDADSLVTLDGALKTQGAENVIWNFHPYMGPPQAGVANKCPSGFEALVQQVQNSTSRPVIITEFGQSCCATAGACESCPTSSVGYDEAIIQIAQAHGVSWLPWAWRPMATGPDTKKCEDINGGTDPAGSSLAHPTDGKGADFLTLWNTYGPKP